jgi:hypothetical protein
MESNAQQPAKSLVGWLFAAHGLYVIIAGLAVAVFAWLIPMLLVKVVNSDIIDPRSVPGAARFAIDNRAVMPLLAAPAIAFGVAGICKIRPHWLWAALGFLALLLAAMFLLYTFIVTMAQLYQINLL